MSKINSINKLPPSLAADRFYAMAQSGMLKASPREIYLGGGFIVAGILESIGINDNKIISGISNFIPGPSNLQYMVKKARETKFMRIAGFI